MIAHDRLMGLKRCLLLLAITILAGNVLAADSDDLSFSEAIRVLAREQSQAESYVGLLNTVAKADVPKYARGILLYADAKAEFDGLIEQMKADLTRGRSPDTSSDFQKQLQHAVDRRTVFTTYVSEKIVGDEEGQKGIVTGVATAATLLPLLGKASQTIWKEFRQVSDTRKKEILTQLDGLKWRAFHEIPGSR
ncbi:MAG: hypothetical protein ETSY2_35285 [Candidatus Entotheonella gemina]|uniref:Uncharacterized protein n=1 Tax=Candidatus Entotheonella gemina TaxID=1429439 RepID=W4LXE4_9BACT|nr:MAG: hypothetical protein ETSY2_35285 [Candidatus Entotheonella gemina]